MFYFICGLLGTQFVLQHLSRRHALHKPSFFFFFTGDENTELGNFFFFSSLMAPFLVI